MRTRVLLVGLAAIAVVGFGAGVARAGGGCHGTSPAEVATTTVALEEMCMRPGVVRVEPGATVTFTNRDQMVHNLYGPGWFEGELAPGASTTRTYDTAGTYTYGCTLHAGMTGAVVVADPQLVSSTSAPATDDGSSAGLVTVAILAGVALLGAGFAVGHRRARRPADVG